MFTSLQACRIRATTVAVALASWASAAAVVLLAILRFHVAVVALFAVAAALWVVSFLLSWSLYCPWCCRVLFFVTPLSASPSGKQLAHQFFPYETIANSRFKCPHCRSRFALPKGER